jgi:hypothetical protein
MESMARARLNYKYLLGHAPDILLLCIFGTAAFFLNWIAFKSLIPAILDWSAYNFWFDGDPPLVYLNLRVIANEYSITNHHPLLAIITVPIVQSMEILLGIGGAIAVGMLMSVAAGCCVCLLYLLLRLVRLPYLDASVFSILFMVSASSVFWFPIPETLSIGSATVLLALVVAAFSERIKKLPTLYFIATSVATLSITTTHWMAGLAMLFSQFPWRRALLLAGCSLVIVILAAFLQLWLFPGSDLFFLLGKYEKSWVFHSGAGGFWTIMQSFFLHSVIMPEVKLSFYDGIQSPGGKWLITQGLIPGSGSSAGLAATFVWLALLAMGIWGFIRDPLRLKASIAMIAVLLGQLLLHLVYGVETFFYSLTWTPLLVAMSGFAHDSAPIVSQSGCCSSYCWAGIIYLHFPKPEIS